MSFSSVPKRHIDERHFQRLVGVMAAHQTPDLRVTGSIPVRVINGVLNRQSLLPPSHPIQKKWRWGADVDCGRMVAVKWVWAVGSGEGGEWHVLLPLDNVIQFCLLRQKGVVAYAPIALVAPTRWHANEVASHALNPLLPASPTHHHR